MTFSFGHSPFLLALALVAAAAFAWWTYGRSVPAVPPARRLLLAGLRTGALFLVLALLFEPVLRRVEAREEPPVLAVLVDESQSLSLEAGAADAVRDVLRRFPDLGGGARLYTFAADLDPLEGTPDSLAFSGARTDIAQALRRVEEDLEGENLRGVVLLTDGRYNTGRNPVYLAERYGVPIYTAVVGDTTAQRDVLVGRVVTNEVAYAGVALPVEAAVRADGFAGERATVALYEGGQQLDAETVTLPESGAEVSVELEVTPESEGLHRYAVAVTRFDGEVTHENNLESVAVRVLSNRRRVLLLAGAPGPDLSAARQALSRDPNLEIEARTQQGARRFYEGPLPADLADYDLAVLVGFPGPATDPATARRVAEAAADGLPLLFLLTRQTDLRRLNEALGDALPARPDVVRFGFVEAEPVPTAAGTLHPVLDVAGVPADGLDRLPPVLYNESRWLAAPDARTLATTRVRGVALEDPLLVVRQRGRLRSAALLGAGTWRWQNLPEGLGRLDPFYPGLMENLVRWLTTREDDRPVRVRPTADLFGEGEPVEFTGQVYDESLNPVDDAAVEVVVRAPDGTDRPYPMRALGNGRYALDAGTLPEGDYTYTARAAQAGQPLGEDRGAFAVGALALEFRDTRADAPLLRQLARRSGGEVVPVEEVPALPARLAERGRLTPLVVEEEEETALWQIAPLLGLVVLLLAAEWVLRKRSGMV